MYIHKFIFQIKKQEWFHLRKTFWRDLISKNKKTKYITKKVKTKPSLSPSESITGEINTTVKSILLIEAITKADNVLSFVLVISFIVQKVIKTKATLKRYIFQRGIIKRIS